MDIYPAVVVAEAVDDPRGLNRVRVRVFGVHYADTPEDILPWAQVASLGGGAPDSGSAYKYIKGSTVMVAFEMSDLSRPWIVWGIDKEVDASWQSYGGDDWQAEADATNEVPQEALSNEVTCVFKTPKGAALYIDEADGQERLVLVDRAGQAVELVAPVLAGSNVQNAARRGVGLASAEAGLSYEDLAGPAYIRATDVGGNSVLLYAEDGEERVEIENEAHGNSLRFDKDGFVVQVLGGQSGGGLTIVGSSAGLKVNGQFLATESLVSWLKSHETAVAQSTKPGTPEPLFPPAKAEFDTKEGASINSSGMRTTL